MDLLYIKKRSEIDNEMWFPALSFQYQLVHYSKCKLAWVIYEFSPHSRSKTLAWTFLRLLPSWSMVHKLTCLIVRVDCLAKLKLDVTKRRLSTCPAKWTLSLSTWIMPAFQISQVVVECNLLEFDSRTSATLSPMNACPS